MTKLRGGPLNTNQHEQCVHYACRLYAYQGTEMLELAKAGKPPSSHVAHPKRGRRRETNTSGVIRSGELYTLVAFKAALGLSDAAYRALVREGLPVIRRGKRAFLLGSQVIAFMEGRHEIQA